MMPSVVRCPYQRDISRQRVRAGRVPVSNDLQGGLIDGLRLGLQTARKKRMPILAARTINCCPQPTRRQRMSAGRRAPHGIQDERRRFR
jgi:hypothetical protein